LVAGVAALAFLVFSAPHAEAKANKHPHAKSATAHHVDGGVMEQMFTASKRGEWTKATALAKKADDPLASDLAEWLFLTDESTTPTFQELSEFLDAHPSWPGHGSMLTKAEQAIPEGMRAEAIVAWFGNREPKTGDGALRLGEAKLALGNRSEGEAIIRRAWIEKDFTPDAERRALAEHSVILAGAPTSDRVARLLWQRRTSDANRVLDDAEGDARELAKARITLISQPQRLSSVIDSLPSSLRNDSSILFEQVRASRQSEDIPAAVSVALKADMGQAAARWWPQRHALAREALSLGLYQEAYRLAAEHGLTPGPDFADAEWLAGWIALRFLDKPQLAVEHFQTLYKNVSYPVSKARGAYWMGRAYEQLGRLADAAGDYQTAAGFPTTYYGQLAADRIAPEDATLPLPAQPSGGTHTALAGSELAQVARLASETRAESVVRPFFMALGEAADTPQDYLFAGKLAIELGHPGLAVRIAKKAMQDDIVLTDIAYPVLSVPQAEGSAPEGALILGISRQESEFDAQAESPAGARGLMQLMPATAKVIAKQQHLQFNSARLDDPGYNMRLGMSYLGDLIDRFGGSYALAIAAYNAGPTHTREWLAQNGDPRDPHVDPVDWVEKIPFSETRNYVQRVLENTQVYRSRIAHGPAPLRIAADLARPNPAHPEGENLTAYLKRGSRTMVAQGEERPSKPDKHTEEQVAAAAPAPVPITPEPAAAAAITPPSPAATPAPVPAAPTPAVATSPAPIMPPAPEPKPVQVAEAAPTAVAPVAETAPVIPAIVPQPKPTPPAKAEAKTPAPKAKEKPKLASAKAKKRAHEEGEEEENLAGAPTLVQAAATPPSGANPFGNGQPETARIQSSCSRMILDAKGKPKCAEGQAATE
jgi:soluble lytic murein transglycosylase